MKKQANLVGNSIKRVFARGAHFAQGVDAFRRDEPRVLPTYFSDPDNHDATAWLNGWDHGKVLAAPAAQQPYEVFCENTLVFHVHRAHDGNWKLGRALGDGPDEVARLRLTLLSEYGRRSAAQAHALLEQFERTLAGADIWGDVVFLAGHLARGKHFILNTMLMTPPDILERVHEQEVAMAVHNGAAVHVPESAEDPREALLARRQRSVTPVAAAA